MEDEYCKLGFFITHQMVNIAQQDLQVVAVGAGERERIKGLLSHLERSF